jgi:hypothetical protein
MLTSTTQDMLPFQTPWYVLQLLLQAFLQRIVNSGGRIERAYALGRMRTDLLVFWPVKTDEVNESDSISDRLQIQKIVIELKLLHKTMEKAIEDGLKQTREYMQKCKAEEGHLVIFDRGTQKSWDEKIFMREVEIKGQKIMIWGM